MQLTFWGYVLSIAVLVLIALLTIGIGFAFAGSFDAKGHTYSAMASGVLGITVACILPVAFVGFQADVYRVSPETGIWEKSSWILGFKDDDGERHSFGFGGSRYFYAGANENAATKLYMKYPVVYTSDYDLIGTRVKNLPSTEVIAVKGGDFIPLDANISFIGQAEGEYELESYQNNETKTLWCFGEYRPLTAADSVYHRLITVAPSLPYQD